MATGSRRGWEKRGALVLAVLITGLWVDVEAKVELVDHGYEGIVVAINPYLKQEVTILKRLEEYLTNTSKTLFRATRNQLYFREIIVVIPETWKGLHLFENALDIQLDRAQIVIDQANPAYGDAPYVKQYAECGQPGLYIHLTPTYLLDDDVIHKWGQPEKTLVHEWAHLRWGLFDEYPIDAQDAEFYRHNGVWQPTRCTTDVSGSIRNEFTSSPCSFDFFTGKPEKACRFFPTMKSNKASASLMFMQYLESIVEFCDDPMTAPQQLRHNYLAPNRQNRLCAYRSAWEVMRKHEDFRKARRPLNDDANTKPTFRYVQVQPRKRALVLDTSGSMTGSSLSVMMRAASNYILSCVERGSHLGIVQFNTNATALSPMIQINNEDDRQTLIKTLPRQADGKTSIGAGLEKGLELLNTLEPDKPGGTLILITDGKENERPFLGDFQQKLERKGVVVHSLAYGQRAEKSIAQLSRKTGGKTFFYSGRKDSTALIDGLAATMRSSGPEVTTFVPISLLTEASTVDDKTPWLGSFFIDTTVGTDTSITVSYSSDVTTSVTSPTGLVMTEGSNPQHFHQDKESGVLKIILPGTAEAGKWSFSIVNSNATKSDVIINVQSASRSDKGNVLQIASWLSYLPDNNTVAFDARQKITVFAELVRGRAPVLGADVTAIIERPQSLSLKVPLYDNGIGSDVIKDDGVYAAYVLPGDMMGDGRYNIKIKAKGMEGVTRVVTGAGGRSSGALDLSGDAMRTELQTEALEQFQRVTTAGEFAVTNFPTDSSRLELPDLLAPSRITDFHVTSFDPDSGQAELRWTAVGGDLDRGSAARYHVQMSNRFDTLFAMLPNDTGLFDPGVDAAVKGLTPRMAGESETLTLWLAALLDRSIREEMGDDNVTLFAAVLAVDSGGNRGEQSNIVTLSEARSLSVQVQTDPVSTGGGLHAGFYLKLVVPPVAGLVLVFAVFVLVSRRGRGGGKGGRGVCGSGADPVDEKRFRGSTYSIDLSHEGYMNYRQDGQYRPRHKEIAETWSDVGKSRESLDAI